MRARVKQLLDQAPLQLKLAIALQAFSGLRPSDVYDLTFEDFEPDFSEGVTPVCLFVKSQKAQGRPFITFVPAQTLEYLTFLKEAIEAKGEMMTPSTKLFNWSSSDSLSIMADF